MALMKTPSNISAVHGQGNNPFKSKKGKGLFVGGSNSGELMINLGSKLGITPGDSTNQSPNRKHLLDQSRTTITDNQNT